MKRSLIENHPNPNKGRARCYDVLLMSSHNWKKPQNVKIWRTTFEIVFCVKLQSCQKANAYIAMSSDTLIWEDIKGRWAFLT